MGVFLDGLKNTFLMAYEVWWALVLGFAISAIVQAWVPRERIQAALSGGGPRSVGWATALGAASSSCSYAAVALTRSLFGKGANFSAGGTRADVSVIDSSGNRHSHIPTAGRVGHARRMGSAPVLPPSGGWSSSRLPAAAEGTTGADGGNRPSPDFSDCWILDARS